MWKIVYKDDCVIEFLLVSLKMAHMVKIPFIVFRLARLTSSGQAIH